MPSYLAVSGTWTKVMPPADLIARSPRVPSDPVPDRMIPMARSSYSSAMDWNSRLTEGLGATSGDGVLSRKRLALNTRL